MRFTSATGGVPTLWDEIQAASAQAKIRITQELTRLLNRMQPSGSPIPH